MRPLRVITLAGDASREPEVAAAITREPGLELVLRCVDRVEALAALRGASVDVAVAVGPVAWFDYQCLQEFRARGIRVLGLASDPVQVEGLEVTGVEVIPPHKGVADLPELLEGPALSPVEEPSGNKGRLIAVWGAKGAPGRTSVAVELASTLALSQPSTLLLDADLYGGDVAQVLGLTAELPGLVALSRHGAKGELAGTAWSEELRRAEPHGPLLVPGLLRAELWEEVSPFGWSAVLEAATATFRFTVADVGFCLESSRSAPGRNEIARCTVSAASHVVAVVRADPIGVKNFLWALNDIRDLELAERVLVVLNRVRPGEAKDLRVVLKRHMGRLPVTEIPDRPDLFARALWQGRSLSSTDPQSEISARVRDLAAAVGAAVPPRGFLARLAGRTHV